ncbi:IclR family transcriptional regulator domain-containing protein [Falsiroseomonas selenitidurans]|uniref:Helix-turn-helix domain-containing protein n=1 Tax=Falsiroseomonas selenitidurans TaxID=2716335 RepID=A0ABX1E7J7_9PROT|nr:IclR family transcriptional regulator C-terminal domain-containing protein [Falsiroseomonas selenitidurans]NKC33194.1 helix-turn-helix domain-containing protein [Falsiroseomonas selenitidurans]
MPRLNAGDATRREAAGHGPDFLEALARGLAVLQAFGPERRQMTLAEAARAVDLPRATVRRALHTLVTLGHLESDGRLFRLTPRVLRLAAGYLGANGLSSILQPRCEQLSAQFGAPCSAAVLDGPEIVFIAYGQPARLLNLTTMVGLRLPAFCTALGRVLLAGLPEAEMEALLQRHPPHAVTAQTELDPLRIRRRIARARSEGFALVDQEAEQGFRSLAVPLRRHDGRVVAALNIGMHSERGTAAALREAVLPTLRAQAADLACQFL